MSYIPSAQILMNYSEVLIWLALWSWVWIKAGDVVMLQVPESAKPLLPYLHKSVLQRWWHPLVRYLPDWIAKDLYEFGTEEQIAYMPHTYMLWMVEDIDHIVSIVADVDKHELEWISPDKIMNRTKAWRFFKDALQEKEHQNKFTRTVWLYWTQAMAQEVWLTLQEYREQIIFACFLDDAQPIQKRTEVLQEVENTKDLLNSLPIESLHIRGEDIDLKVTLWSNRKWLGGTGRNIPSFEVFISPDRRGTEWWIKCNQPLYAYGSIIKDIELTFSEGVIVSSKASLNEHLLKEMIETENADKIGEFSLTDKRLSRITQFMWETLYDENVWWPYWNTHIALGSAYKESFPWDVPAVTTQERSDMWYNTSSIHTDIVSTADRTVVAYLADWREMIIYQDGMFTLA